MSSKAFKIIPVRGDKSGKVCFILATHDLYLRYFANEELLIEQKIFAKTKLKQVCRSGPYVGCLSQNNKFKVYYFKPENEKF